MLAEELGKYILCIIRYLQKSSMAQGQMVKVMKIVFDDQATGEGKISFWNVLIYVSS